MRSILKTFSDVPSRLQKSWLIRRWWLIKFHEVVWRSVQLFSRSKVMETCRVVDSETGKQRDVRVRKINFHFSSIARGLIKYARKCFIFIVEYTYMFCVSARSHFIPLSTSHEFIHSSSFRSQDTKVFSWYFPVSCVLSDPEKHLCRIFEFRESIARKDIPNFTSRVARNHSGFRILR